MRILSWRGQVVEGAGLGRKRLMGMIGDRQALGKLRQNERLERVYGHRAGGTFIHILNGQLMAVMVDDDPGSSNNQPGLFGIEIEATTKVSVRSIWLKKLNDPIATSQRQTLVDLLCHDRISRYEYNSWLFPAGLCPCGIRPDRRPEFEVASIRSSAQPGTRRSTSACTSMEPGRCTYFR